ncbi:DUF3168 domain-containing protein [Rhodovulum sp. BSW8]|uniref:DUF3168 domain-containing protein n=1 Tax=Rhodovulum visakhapatnamense TaxID=364297 RepID=A0A4R8FB14_9RHOB|nr:MULTISPECIES: DUF3168 domain-containing protein [Rhodovulum]OLS44299.1 hypothetical protein BV509_08065 [Rhodovulum sulfidophilum]MBL3569379.1 DUF3168 domain-containing protein [Rhodovulum visakhapatnamense]MBL3576736.1 DUF3168 domain-containing protein [Rhodovulum visakhapatnamense]RBO54368.1 DUF3168 domain-containing protein [Rhodovulum sp. BSW8]TDX22900.1 uncharacterized protein DUF3168 [Rhodovulum visakhapatnamense]
MSYGMAAALQAAIFQRISGHAAVAAIVGEAVYDAVPAGRLPPIYVSLGPEEVRDASDKDAGGALHLVTISVVSEEAGFARAKAAAGAISDALTEAPLVLVRGRVVGLWFDRARARRVGAQDQRRIDLRFSVRVEDD